MKCNICGNEIPKERVEALVILQTPIEKFFCIGCATHQVQKVKGIYLGESGNSPLVMCDSIAQGREKLFEDIKDEENKDA